jgi:hypothetical protein
MRAIILLVNNPAFYLQVLEQRNPDFSDAADDLRSPLHSGYERRD